MILLLFILLLCFFIAGSLVSLMLWNNKETANLTSNLFAIAGSIIGIILGGVILLTHSITTIFLLTNLPLFTISLRLDGLAGYFILLISVVALACSFYGVAYM